MYAGKLFGHKRRQEKSRTRGGQDPVTEPSHKIQGAASQCGQLFFKIETQTVNCLEKLPAGSLQSSAIGSFVSAVFVATYRDVLGCLDRFYFHTSRDCAPDV